MSAGGLPIDGLLPDVIGALRGANRVVLRAPPGAGKTTRVPGALLDAGLAAEKQVVVLEPRRIAARAAADFVAAERGGRLGDEVGYRVRFERRGGAATRLWFLTEGVLGRQLARDPYLDAVGVVVLDEFHERHLQGDIALAVVRELQETVRPELRLVVMSATLETEALASYLGGCPVLTSEGRTYPVRIEHAAEKDDRPLAGRVVSALGRLLAEGDDGGDVLVFLPGAAEIRRAAAAIEDLAREQRIDVLSLHGDLPLEAQQRALRRGPRRKVVLATNVAETSLTIDGVTAVIDSGLARVARFDARHGINRLAVASVSRASAEQRAGRAGRTAPGRCVRLWTGAEHAERLEREVPEIRRLDLSAMLLELHGWGLEDVDGLAWLDPPSPAAAARAARLLAEIGAVDSEGRITGTGRRMLAVSAPPRLARMLVEAERGGFRETGALIAALASERDISAAERAFGRVDEGRWPAGPSDLLLRADLFREAERRRFSPDACRSLGLERRAVLAVERTRRAFLGALSAPGRADQGDGGRPRAGSDARSEELLRCTVLGFPDRVVRRREPGSMRGVMVGGKGVTLADGSVVREAPFFVAVEIEAGRGAGRPDALVRLASAVRPEWLRELFPAACRAVSEVEFHAGGERVVGREREFFHDLLLAERVRLDVDADAASEVLGRAALADPESAAGLGAAERGLLSRVAFLCRWRPELGLPEPEALLADALGALCHGRRSFAELRRANLLAVLQGLLAAAVRAALEREAPARFALPSGRAASIDYGDPARPKVEARIQELFGLGATPRLAAGRVPLLVHLLAPNQRPVQITDDLDSFWRNTYAEVRKQLRGRYPKHAWPEDPATATPTSRVRRGGSGGGR